MSKEIQVDTLSLSRGFIIDQQGKLHSVLMDMSKAPGITVGVGIVVERDIVIEDMGTVKAGAKGWFEYGDALTGLAQFMMEGHEPALRHWENRLCLVPFDTDDITDACVATLQTVRSPTQMWIEETLELRAS
jgi:hypothetical protein